MLWECILRAVDEGEWESGRVETGLENVNIYVESGSDLNIWF